MHKRKIPRDDSQLVHIRIAVEETGLPYALLWGAVGRGEIRSLRGVDSTGQVRKGASIYLQRESLNAWIDQRLSKREAA